MLSIIALSVIATGPRILFIGNSHTQVNDLPAMVKTLLETDGSGRHATVKRVWATLLNNLPLYQAQSELKHGAWDYVVLQGALLSSSHLYHYSQDGGIAIAKMARQSGARVLLFAEWPRRGWDEADFIVQGYGEISKPAMAEIVDVPHVFAVVHKEFPKAELWQPDGNHATEAGTYIAARTIYRWVVGGKATPAADGKLGIGFSRAIDKAALAAYKASRHGAQAAL
jgi:hypothetical protein